MKRVLFVIVTTVFAAASLLAYTAGKVPLAIAAACVPVVVAFTAHAIRHGQRLGYSDFS